VGGLLEKVTTGAGTDFRHMIRAGGASIIVSRQSSGTNSTYYVTRDHLGSSSAVTNSAGGVLVNSSFDAFGKRRGSNWSGSPSGGDWTAIAATTRRGYTDHTMLDNVGLIHMNGRVQDPVLGRFASADPFITEPGFTQNFNRYSYVYNNSLTYSDPSGFCGEDTGRPAPKDANGDGVPDDGGRQDGSASAAGAAACMQEMMEAGVQRLLEVVVTCDAACQAQIKRQMEAMKDAYIASLDLKVQSTIPGQSAIAGGSEKQPGVPQQDPRCSAPLPGGRTVNENVREFQIRATLERKAGGTGLNTYLQWFFAVAPHGTQDYKWHLPNFDERPGNFSYGATGSVFHSDNALRGAAGIVQLLTAPSGYEGGVPFLIAPHGDEIVDQQQIQAGIEGGCG
jgi:RHS repeat-associated protein